MIPCINQTTVLTANTKRFLELSKAHNFEHVIGEINDWMI